MEPFSREDPLYKILGKAKTVEPRSNFTQNVLRAIRQEPPVESMWAKVKECFTLHPLAIGATTAILLTGLSLSLLNTDTKTATAPDFAQVQTPSTTSKVTLPHLEEEGTAITDSTVVSELGDMERLSTLLAQQDTTTFSDGEIALLLY